MTDEERFRDLQSSYDGLKAAIKRLEAENHVLRSLLVSQGIQFNHASYTARRVWAFCTAQYPIEARRSQRGTEVYPTREGELPADRFLNRLIELLQK